MSTPERDLELSQACARALGFPTMQSTVAGERDPTPIIMYRPSGQWVWYQPLYDNAQAMALVKRFEIQLWPDHERKQGNAKLLGWTAYIFKIGSVTSPDLNRSIVECAAKLA